MITVSNEAKELITNNHLNYKFKARINFVNGSYINITEQDLWNNGLQIEESTSNDESFDIGSVIIGQMTLVLNNLNNRFVNKDFFNASIVPYLGVVLSDGSTEWIRKGFYTVDEPEYNGAFITLTLLDGMWYFDKDYSYLDVTYPTTAGNLIAKICRSANINLAKANFPNADLTIYKPSNEDTEMNCREVIGYIAQICGCYAKMNSMGQLVMAWYDKSEAINTNTLADIKYISNMNIAQNSLQVTGLALKTSSETDSTSYYYLYGSDDYVLTILDNPFVNADNVSTYANAIGDSIVGLKIYKFNIQAKNNLLYEAGDRCKITDAKGKTYYSYITRTSYSINSNETFVCGAETPRRQLVKQFNQEVKIATEVAKAEAETRISTYDAAVQRMNALASNAMGLRWAEAKDFTTGTSIFYMSNKPITEYDDGTVSFTVGSKVWKMTGDGFFVCTSAKLTDNLCSWTAGWDSNNNVVVNTLSTVGISFDWAQGGTLTLGGNGNSNGQLVVKNSSDKTLVTLDNRGMTLDSSVKISWNSISNAPTIPTNVSDLNDANNYAKKTDVSNTYVSIKSIYYRTSLTTVPSAPASEVTTTSTTLINAWTLGFLPYWENYKIYTCNQMKAYDGTISCTPVVEYVDGNVATEITKDTVTTSYINALNVTAKYVACENLTGTTINGKIINVGGYSDGKGSIKIYNSSNQSVGHWDSSGLTISSATYEGNYLYSIRIKTNGVLETGYEYNGMTYDGIKINARSISHGTSSISLEDNSNGIEIYSKNTVTLTCSLDSIAGSGFVLKPYDVYLRMPYSSCDFNVTDYNGNSYNTVRKKSITLGGSSYVIRYGLICAS